MGARETIENQFLSILISAMNKGMTPEQFFGVADTALSHMRGKNKNETIDKVMRDEAEPKDIAQLVRSITTPVTGL